MLNNPTSNDNALIALGDFYHTSGSTNDNILSSENLYISELFEKQALKTPDQIAIAYQSYSITYKELNSHANKVARYLKDRKVKPNSFIGVFQNNSIEAITSILGILKAGAAFIPIDVSYPLKRIEYMIKSADISLILSTKNHINLNIDYENFIDINSPEILTKYSDKNLTCTTKPSDIIYLIYTSGTTGSPKGAVLSHRGVNNLLKWYINYCSINQSDKILILSSLSFDLTYKNIFCGLLSGSQVHLININPFDPDSIIETIFKNKITFLNCTPSVFYSLCEHQNVSKMQSLRMLCLGGEPINSNRLKIFNQDCPETIIANTYGPTECSDLACAYTLTKSDIQECKAIPIGKTLPGVEVFILNDKLELASLNEPGELYIAGIGVGEGYYNNPEETEKNFIQNSLISSPQHSKLKLYKTGDRAKELSKGFFQYLGRIDDQIKLRGLRIEPIEVENAIIEEINVKQVIVLRNEISDTNQTLDAYLVSDADKIDIPTLKKKLSLKLPEYMVPSRYFITKNCPKTPNGKLDKPALLTNSIELKFSDNFSAPRTYEEQALLAIWAEVLHKDPFLISIHDNFFDLGGYSILATQVILRIKRIFGIYLSIDRLFHSPTINKLAYEISKHATKKNNQPVISDIEKSKKLTGSLSYSQQRIWFLSNLLPKSGFYNLPSAFLIKGSFDISSFKKALRILVDRHEMLRTSFNEKNGIPFQQVHNDINIDQHIEVLDLKLFEPSEAKLIVSNSITQDANLAFNLNAPLIMRIKIFSLPNNENVFYINYHHIIFDGWSWNIFKREISELYNAIITKKDIPQNINPIRYIDYVTWQNNTYTAESFTEAEKYWHEHLKDVKNYALPTDFPRPSDPLFQGRRVRVDLPENTYQNLEKIAQSHHTTFFTILITIFNITLYKYSGINQITISTPVANRLNEKLEGLIGYFINTVLFYTEIKSELSIKELLLANKETHIKLLSYQDYPFEKLVKELKIDRQINKNPMSQIMFSFQNHQVDFLNFTGTSLNTLEIDTHYSRFDIEWQVWLEGRKLSIDIFYNSELYKESTIKKLYDDFENLLANISSLLDTKLIDLYYKDTKDLSVISGQYINLNSQLLNNYIEEHANNTPQKIALFTDKLELSFYKLNSLANKVAHYLTERGISKGDRVAIIMERSEKPLLIFIACMKLGAVFIPISADNPPDRIGLIIKDAVPKLIIKDKGIYEVDVNDIKQLVINDIENELLAYSHLNPNICINNNEPVYIIYTSGSTGQPKGVVIRHKSLLNIILSTAHEIGFCSDSHWLAITTFSFDIALLELFTPLIIGGKLTIASKQTISNTALLIDTISKIDNPILQTTPSFWKILLNANWNNVKNIKIITGGEPLSRPLANSLLEKGAQVWNAYGPTETAIWSTFEPISNENGLVPLGSPIFNTRCYVINEQGSIVAKGQAGELYIAGEGVALSYWNQPALTRTKFVELILPNGKTERCFRTGDQVTHQENGKIIFHGRIDDQVKYNGYRIELGEIEQTLMQHSYVDQAAVIMQNHETRPYLSAFISLNDRQYFNHTENSTENWEIIFNNIYNRINRESADKFDGWINSYTRQQISNIEMESWLSCCVESIKKINPKSIIEIGCGLGLLIPEIAPLANRYIAIDISEHAISSLKNQFFSNNVEAIRAPAHKSSEFINNSTDTVIINSVFQYFPSLNYFEEVLESIINKISNESVIFIGDVRGYELSKYFHASLLQHQNKLNDDDIINRKNKIELSIKNDRELLVSPSYFLQLSKKYPAITFVEIQPKPGDYSNELNKFRFDVYIHIKSKKSILQPNITIDCKESNLNLNKIKDILANNDSKICLIKNIFNRFLKNDFRSFSILFENSNIHTSYTTSIAPYELNDLSKSIGLCIKFQLNPFLPGVYDAIIYPNNDATKSSIFPIINAISVFEAHEPINNSFLTKNLLAFLAEKLPYYMLPSEINITESFPLSLNGKIDKKLLSIAKKQGSLPTQAINSTDPIEKALSKLWLEALQINNISLNDNFFDIGGHSLLAIHLLAMSNQHFEVNLLIYDFYKDPTFTGHLKLIKNHISKLEPFSQATLTATQTQRPYLFLIPPIDGDSSWYNEIINCLNDKFSSYTFKQSLNNSDLIDVETIAQNYHKKIKSIQPDGPYHLLGWSFGGIVAYEIGILLQQHGESVKNLILIDTPTPQDSSAIASAHNNIMSLQSLQKKITTFNKDSSQLIYLNSNAYIKYMLKPNSFKNAIIIKANEQNFNLSINNSWEKIFNTDYISIKEADHYSIMKSPYIKQVVSYIIKHMEN